MNTTRRFSSGPRDLCLYALSLPILTLPLDLDLDLGNKIVDPTARHRHLHLHTYICADTWRQSVAQRSRGVVDGAGPGGVASAQQGLCKMAAPSLDEQRQAHTDAGFGFSVSCSEWPNGQTDSLHFSTEHCTCWQGTIRTCLYYPTALL